MGAIFKVVDQVVAMNCQTGIAVVELGTIEVNTMAAFYAEQKHSIRKTVNIWVDCEPEFNQSGGLKVFQRLHIEKFASDEKLFQINIGSRRPRTQFSDMLDIQVKSDPDGNPKNREVVLSIFSDILPKWLV